MSKDYALVNKETKIVADTVVWDGESWLPEEYFELYDMIPIDPNIKGHLVVPGFTYRPELNNFLPLPPVDNPERYSFDEEKYMWKLLPEFAPEDAS